MTLQPGIVVRGFTPPLQLADFKLVAFDTAVNVSLGLPIDRSSVDHGTAFDIAWQGVAFTDSLDHALAYAWKLAGRVEHPA